MSRILVIEDNPLNGRLVRDILHHRGHEVVVTLDVAGARGELGSMRPDIVLADLHLPDGTGHDVLAIVRADTGLAGVPVVVLTASAMRGDREALLAAGFDGYISKPIDTRAFGPLVEQLAAARRTSS